MTACQLNFLPNITCNTNVTTISINNILAPYYCINQLTNQLCTNNSECCKSGYQFDDDVQQCLCKYSSTKYCWKIFFFIGQPVCNDFLCGNNGTCVNSELQPNGYICNCENKTSVFNGTTCIRMY